jgi:hypothetical protein
MMWVTPGTPAAFGVIPPGAAPASGRPGGLRGRRLVGGERHQRLRHAGNGSGGFLCCDAHWLHRGGFCRVDPDREHRLAVIDDNVGQPA